MAAPNVFKDKRLWLGGYGFDPQFNSFTLDAGLPMVDATSMADLARVELASIENPRVSGDVMVPSAADPLEAEMFTRVGQDVVATLSTEDNTVGSVAYSWRAMRLSHEPGGTVGELSVYTLTMASSGQPMLRGQLLEVGTQRVPDPSAAPVPGESLNLGAVASGDTLYLAYHVIETDGDLDAVLQSDDAGGFPSPTTRITTSTWSTVGAELLSVAGPITDTWYRLLFTPGASTTQWAVAACLINHTPIT